MKVLFYCFTLPHYRQTLFRRLRDQFGWNITIVYSEREGSNDSVTGIGMSSEFQRYFRLVPLSRKTLVFPFRRFFYLRGLSRRLRYSDFHFVIFHGSLFDIGAIKGLLACRRKGVPCALWSKGYASESVRNRFVNRVVFASFYKLPDVLIPYGDRSRQYFITLGIRPEKIVQAYNAVDIEGIAEKQHLLKRAGRTYLHGVLADRGIPTIVTVGRLIQKKRVNDLVMAISALRKRGIELNCVIGGSGPLQFELGELVRRERLDDRVFLLGRMPKGIDSAVLAIGDAAVFCGGHGLAINQAMALGVPVIASDDLSPDSEMIRGGETGWLFRKGDVRDLADIIHRVISEKQSVVESIRLNAKKEILGNRSEAQYAESFRCAYDVARKSRN